MSKQLDNSPGGTDATADVIDQGHKEQPQAQEPAQVLPEAQERQEPAQLLPQEPLLEPARERQLTEPPLDAAQPQEPALERQVAAPAAALQGSSPPPSAARTVGAGLLITGLYTLLACAALFPVPLHMNERIIGGGELGGWLWRYWLMKLELASLWVELTSRPLDFFLQMISLGRFPETGNIADLYFISWPLDQLFGHPAYYNIKCLMILVLDALAGYALARHFTRDRLLAFAGGLVAGFNSFVFLELYESGLRQAILWWLILAILYLERVIERGRIRDGLLAGLFFGLTAGFYWFYGVFLGMYAAARGLIALIPILRSERRLHIIASTGLLLAASSGIAYVFAYPYIYFKTDHTGALPEVQWFASFPSLSELQNAPKFPVTLAENLLSSLARVLPSSWSLDYLWNPLHPRAVPIALTILALTPAIIRIRREWFWLLVAIFFWLHTGGPYLQHDFHAGERGYVLMDGEPVRLPYYYTFKYVPMMSRLFAPYRSGALLWVALAVLLIRNLEAIRRRSARHPAMFNGFVVVFMGMYLGQYFLDHDIVRWFKVEGVGLSGRGLPVDNSEMSVHPFYHRLAQEPGQIGVIDVPLQVQQDLTNYYQVVHEKKVFKGWAVPGALPPALRFLQHSEKPETKKLMWIVSPDTPMENSFGNALQRLNQAPYVLGNYDTADRDDLGKRGFKYLILHERGCFMVLPPRGAALYEALRRRLTKHLGEYSEYIELVSSIDPEVGKIEAGTLGEWASSAIPGNAAHITRFRMSVYRMPGYIEPAVTDTLSTPAAQAPSPGSTAPQPAPASGTTVAPQPAASSGANAGAQPAPSSGTTTTPQAPPGAAPASPANPSH